MAEIMKRVCPHCNKEFTTDNKQKFYCTQKCSMAKGYIAHKQRKQKEKEQSKKFFSFDDYKDGLI